MNAELYDALTAAGTPEDKARAAAVSLATFPYDANLATKDDLAEVREDIKAEMANLVTRTELKAEMANLVTRAELKAEMANLVTRAELKAEVAKLATQDDLAEVRTELKAEITGVREELKAEITGVRTDLNNEITGVRTELKAEITTVREELIVVRNDLRWIKWMLAAILTSMLAMMVRIVLFPL